MRSHHCDLQIRMNRSIIISRLVDHELEQREEIESGCSSCPCQVLSIQMRVMRDYADSEQPTTGQQSSKIESSGKKLFSKQHEPSLPVSRRCGSLKSEKLYQKFL